MTTKSLPLPDREGPAEGRRAERQGAAVCQAVLAGLGRPRDLFRVSAVRLWENHFRVNVQTGPDATSVGTPHSFFVTADDDGVVLESVPRITRLY